MKIEFECDILFLQNIYYGDKIMDKEYMGTLTLAERIKNFLSGRKKTATVESEEISLQPEAPVQREKENSDIYNMQTKGVKATYPDGFTFEELQDIDFKEFGAILKQRRLLPPSYDRNPIMVDIYYGKDNVPRAKVTFQSKTVGTMRTIGIKKYETLSSIPNCYHLYDHNEDIDKAWEDCASHIRFKMIRENNRRKVIEMLYDIREEERKSREAFMTSGNDDGMDNI